MIDKNRIAVIATVLSVFASVGRAQDDSHDRIQQSIIAQANAEAQAQAKEQQARAEWQSHFDQSKPLLAVKHGTTLPSEMPPEIGAALTAGEKLRQAEMVRVRKEISANQYAGGNLALIKSDQKYLNDLTGAPGKYFPYLTSKNGKFNLGDLGTFDEPGYSTLFKIFQITDEHDALIRLSEADSDGPIYMVRGVVTNTHIDDEYVTLPGLYRVADKTVTYKTAAGASNTIIALDSIDLGDYEPQVAPVAHAGHSVADALASYQAARSACIARLAGRDDYKKALADVANAQKERDAAAGDTIMPAAQKLLDAKSAVRKIEEDACATDPAVATAKAALDAARKSQ